MPIFLPDSDKYPRPEYCRNCKICHSHSYDGIWRPWDGDKMIKDVLPGCLPGTTGKNLEMRFAVIEGTRVDQAEAAAPGVNFGEPHRCAVLLPRTGYIRSARRRELLPTFS